VPRAAPCANSAPTRSVHSKRVTPAGVTLAIHIALDLRRMFAEYGHNIIRDLQETAAYVKTLITTAASNAQLTFTQQDEHGCVSAQHTQLSVPGWHNHLVRFAFVNGALGTDDRDLQAVSHLHPSLLLGFFDHVFDAAFHVEGLLGKMIEFTSDDASERFHRVFQLHITTLEAGEHLGNMERL
jgi:hypothetical protein